MRTDDFYVQVLIADIGAQLFTGPHRRESPEGRGEGNQTGFRHPRRDAQQVLLRDTDVKESLRIGLFQHGNLGGLCQVPGQTHNALVVFRQLQQGLAIDFRGGEVNRIQ